VFLGDGLFLLLLLHFLRDFLVALGLVTDQHGLVGLLDRGTLLALHVTRPFDQLELEDILLFVLHGG